MVFAERCDERRCTPSLFARMAFVSQDELSQELEMAGRCHRAEVDVPLDFNTADGQVPYAFD
jgi:hypothetical protein